MPQEKSRDGLKPAEARTTNEDQQDADEIQELRARQEEQVEKKISLNEQRLGALIAALKGIHECVFAVLALESEPVDPRL